jgi:enoyl-CoA hydratase
MASSKTPMKRASARSMPSKRPSNGVLRASTPPKAQAAARAAGPSRARFRTLRYAVDGAVCTLTFNRPERLNAISDATPRELREAVERANADPAVHVIVLKGAGDAFCAGYDLSAYAEGDTTNVYTQPMPWDPMRDYQAMKRNTDDFMSLWRSYKPTIAQIHGLALAGGSDIALCCDLIVMADNAKIGYPPARVWGCPSTGMWVHRIGAERAKRMLFTGDMIEGTTAKAWGLATEAVPLAALEQTVAALAARIASVPKNQLMMQKLMINQAIENQGLATTQMFSTLFDGITRHSPEGLWFKRYAETHGFHAAVALRDSGQPLPEPAPGEEVSTHVKRAVPKQGAKSKWSMKNQ